MGFDEYNNGHQGRGGTMWGNEDWEAGNRRRFHEEQVKNAERFNRSRVSAPDGVGHVGVPLSRP